MQLVEPPRRYTIVESNDLNEVEEHIASRYRRIKLRARGRHKYPAQFGHAILPDCGLKIGFFQTGCKTQLETRDALSFLPVILPIRGSGEITCGNQRFDADPTRAICPARNELMAMNINPDWQQMIVRLNTKTIESKLSALLGHPLDHALEFDRRWDLETEPGQAFVMLAHNILRDLNSEESLLARGLTTRDTEELLINVVLFAHRHNYSDELHESPDKCPPRFVRQARAYLIDNADRQLTISDLVDEIGVSGRTLLRGFRDHYGTTPMAFLKKVRLETAHRFLQRAEPNELVTDIAMRAGFTHLGRFAADYRARYGDTPSETLRSRRRVL